jgi:nucleotide-binding universal stress UspA family protein
LLFPLNNRFARPAIFAKYGGAMAKIRRILAPVDFSDCSRGALEYAFFMAQSFGASVDVLHAWTTPAYVSPYVAVQLSSSGPVQTLEALTREEARRQMDKFLATLEVPEGVELNIRVEFGFEADVITEAASGYDLVVLGTHGRSGLSHFLMGSVAEKVVRKAPCPVLTVRVQQAAERDA